MFVTQITCLFSYPVFCFLLSRSSLFRDLLWFCPLARAVPRSRSGPGIDFLSPCWTGVAFQWRANSGPGTQNGRTALVWAALCGHVDCVRLLIDAGADTDVEDNVRESVDAAALLKCC